MLGLDPSIARRRSSARCARLENAGRARPLADCISAADHDRQPCRRRTREARGEVRSGDALPAAGAAGTALLVGGLLIALSCFHYYTAGFGLLRETTHRGVHLAFVLGLIFLVFSASQGEARTIAPLDWCAAGRRAAAATGCFAVAVASPALYIPWIFDDLAFRVGNPSPIDVVMGTILIVAAARGDAARDRLAAADHRDRLHALCAISAPRCPASSSIRARPGRTSSTTSTSPARASTASRSAWSRPTSSTSCCSACSRRASASASCSSTSPPAVAGRYAGGPAKVSIFGSALFGMISGSSVANTVTVGSLTIPAMIRARLSAPLRGGGGSDRLDRRADHAADHGRRRLPDGRVPERALPDDHRRRDRAGLHAFLRRASCRCISRRSAPGCAA